MGIKCCLCGPGASDGILATQIEKTSAKIAWTAAGKRIQTTAVRFCSTDLKRVVHVVEGRGSGRPAGALTSPKKLPLSCTRAGRERLGLT